MSEIQRVQMRGKSLLPMCYNARISHHEYRTETHDFTGCYGMYDMATEKPCYECEMCGAFVHGDFISRANEVVGE